jgi:hypothetical protein
VDVPETSPPVGAATTCVRPLARVTGISAESGFTASAVFTFGLKSPVSEVSTLPATDPISVNPTTVLASIIPG